MRASISSSLSQKINFLKIFLYSFIFCCLSLCFISSYFFFSKPLSSTEPVINPEVYYYMDLDNLEEFEELALKAENGDLENKKEDIAIFFHIGTVGVSWLKQANKVLNSLENSGLLNESKYHFIFVSGNGTLPPSFNKWNLLYITSKQKFEIATLEYLYHFSIFHPDTKILYLHNKGATRASKAVVDWVDYSLYFYVTRWREMILHLKTHEVVFIDFNYPQSNTFVRWPRIGGNFWWTKGSYARSLPYPSIKNYKHFVGRYSRTLEIEESCRYNAEIWIVILLSKCFKTEPYHSCKEFKKFCCVFQSNVDHYKELYPLERYQYSDISKCLVL